MSKNFSPNAVNQQTFGAAGFDYIAAADTGETALDFVAITILEEATVGANKIVTTTGDDIPASVTLPAGITIYGDFTRVHLSAGKAIAYFRALG